MGEPAVSLGLPNFEVAAVGGFAQFKVDMGGEGSGDVGMLKYSLPTI